GPPPGGVPVVSGSRRRPRRPQGPARAGRLAALAGGRRHGGLAREPERPQPGGPLLNGGTLGRVFLVRDLAFHALLFLPLEQRLGALARATGLVPHWTLLIHLCTGGRLGCTGACTDPVCGSVDQRGRGRM